MYLCYDFETYTKDSKSCVTLIAVIDNKGVYTVFKQSFANEDIIRPFLDFCAMYALKNKKKEITIYAHNAGGYDGHYILQWLTQNQYIQTFKDIKQDNYFKLHSSDLAKILMIELFYKGITLRFKDSFKFLPMSLKKLGEIVGVKKLEGDAYFKSPFYQLSNAEQAKYELYCVTDAKIVKEGIKYLYEFVLSSKSKKVMTLPGAIMKEFKQTIVAQNEDPLYYVKRYKYHPYLINNHYRGGFTYLNPKYQNKVVNNVYYYDINSSYPAVMLEGLPLHPVNTATGVFLITIYASSFKLKPGRIPMVKFNSVEHKYETDKVIYTYKEHYMENKQDLITPLVFWNFEFEHVLYNYDVEYVVLDIVYYTLKPFCKEIITHYQQAKLEADRELKNNKGCIRSISKRTISKLAQNSLYGKFATRDYYIHHLVTDQEFKNKCFCKYNGQYFYIAGISHKKLPNNYKQYNALGLDEVSSDIVYNNVVSSYISAKARVALYKAIMCNEANFIYADTDSIVTTKPLASSFISETGEYGKWKLEGVFKYFKGLKSKCYIATNNYYVFLDPHHKVAVGGVSRFKDSVDISRFTVDDFNMDVIVDQTTVVDAIDGGKMFVVNQKELFRKKIK